MNKEKLKNDINMAIIDTLLVANTAIISHGLVSRDLSLALTFTAAILVVGDIRTRIRSVARNMAGIEKK